MAIRSTIYCFECGETKDVVHSLRGGPPTICNECREWNEKNEKEKHLNALKQLPIEERIAKIEEWIYDLRQDPPWRGRPPLC